jgi:hypothetical protein
MVVRKSINSFHQQQFSLNVHLIALKEDYFSPCRRVQMVHSAMLVGDRRTLANEGFMFYYSLL